jgi:predicted O-methyltransferase YrrM
VGDQIWYRPGGEKGWRRRHIFGATRLRPPVAQHSEAEGGLLRRYAENARCVVEIGVAEGGSAWELRQVIEPSGTLYLVDPYPPGALFGLNMARLVAERLVGNINRGNLVWIRQRSDEAARAWSRSIDFLFIDGDHAYEAVLKDWQTWSRHIRVGGVVAFHDALPSDETGVSRDDGPVRVVQAIRGESPEWEFVEGVDTTAILRRLEQCES